MRISTTERQILKRCLRKWDLESWNRQALTPIINSVALDFGTLWHQVLAAWTKDPTIDPIQLYNHLATLSLDRMRDQYRSIVGCNISEDELKPHKEAILQGLVMLQRYQQKWTTPLPAGFTLVDNELTLIQDIPGTEHCIQLQDGYCRCEACCISEASADCWHNVCEHCINRHQLECTFDGVMADANGDLFIIERKTYSRAPNLDELNYNDQFLAYMWALSKKLPNVVGLAYDGALKNIKKPIDECFLRRILLRSNDELLSFEEHLAYEANHMHTLNQLPYNHPALYPTIPPVTGCQRWECSKIDLCHTMEKKRDTSELLRMFTRSDHKRHLEETIIE